MLHRTLMLAAVAVAPAAAVAGPLDLGRVGIGMNSAFQFVNEFSDAEGYSVLTGQSVFFTTRVSSLTTGGLLDGFDSREAESAVGERFFGEAFPEASLSDYLGFGYFGVIETYEVTDVEGEAVDVLVDRSIIIAVNGILDEDMVRVEDLLGIDEATLVAALTGSFDSPEFFAVLSTVANDPLFQADLRLNEAADGLLTNVREGGSLNLLAFVGGEGGDLGVSLGFLEAEITRVVPAPLSAAPMAMAGLLASRRRRG